MDLAVCKAGPPGLSAGVWGHTGRAHPFPKGQDFREAAAPGVGLNPGVVTFRILAVMSHGLTSRVREVAPEAPCMLSGCYEDTVGHTAACPSRTHGGHFSLASVLAESGLARPQRGLLEHVGARMERLRAFQTVDPGAWASEGGSGQRCGWVGRGNRGWGELGLLTASLPRPEQPVCICFIYHGSWRNDF